MDTDALRWFQLVADGVTVTEVSQIERTTQSGVSRALARLEAEVGTPLLRRSGRRLRMTHAGVAFKRHVDAVMHELDDGIAAVQQLVDPETGTVTLAFQPSLGTWLVPDLVSSFRQEHPAVRFELRPKADELAPAVGARGGVDLELSTLRAADPELHWTRLDAEPLHLAVQAGHRLGELPAVPLASLAGLPFVLLRRSSLLRHQVDDLCAAAGFDADVAFECDDLATLRGFVAAGLGVAVVPAVRRVPGSGAVPGLRHLPISGVPAHRDIGMTRARGRRLLPAAELFASHVASRAAAGLLPAVAEGE